MSALDEVLDGVAREEPPRALRALLRRPLLTATGDPEAFTLVRRHAEALREWLGEESGWSLTVDSEVARLRKVPALPVDGTRPARVRGAPFSRRRYVLLCLALATLERAEPQVTLGSLAQGVLAAAADPALERAGVRFRLEERAERSDLVAVVRLLLELGALRRVEGDEDDYVRDRGDVLYDVERRVTARLLAAPQGPSLVPDGPFEERLTALVAEPDADAEEGGRTVRARRSLTRRLLDDPVVYGAELADAEAEYLGRQRVQLAARIAAETGLVGELRAEGVAMLDPTGQATDVGMPEDGTAGHVTLLLAEHLAARLDEERVAVAGLRAHIARLRAEHGRHWSRAAREEGSEAGLCDDALGRLQALGLVRREGASVRPLPALARFDAGPPRIAGEPS